MPGVSIDRPWVWWHWLMGDWIVRWGLVSMAVAVVVGSVTFALVRLQAVEELQTENVRLNAAVTELQRRLDVQLAAHQQRLVLIEQTMFGTLVPEVAAGEQTKKPVVVLSAPAQWQVNRDKAIQDRIRALEQWRLRIEAER